MHLLCVHEQSLFYHQTIEVEQPLVDAKSKADDRLSQPLQSSEQIAENPLSEAATSQNQEGTTLYSSTEPEPAREVKDESGIIHLPEDTRDR